MGSDEGMAMRGRPRRANYLGPAAMLRLNTACATVRDAFDACPYLVGSVLERPDFRDVDVRLIVDDERYQRMFGDVAGDPHAKHLALLVNSALSDWLAAASGLPVDFQVQPMSEANQHLKQRNALGLHDAAIRYKEQERVNGGEPVRAAAEPPGSGRDQPAGSGLV